MEQKASQLAYKYAKAFLNVNTGTLNSNFIWDVKKAYNFINDNPDTLLILTLPNISKNDKAKALEVLRKNFNLPDCFTKLFELLLKHNRLLICAEVLKYIYLLYPTYTGSLLFEFISATELSVEDQEQFKNFVAKQTGKNILFEAMIDESLIAGVRLQSRNLLWECSIKDRLNRLKVLAVRG